MDDGDVEGMCARMPAWLALVAGPWFIIRMHCHALWHSDRRRRLWIAAELVANLLLVVCVLTVWDSPVLDYHVTVMALGQCLAGFFAVWTVHHGCDRSHQIARTLRGRFKTMISFSMFYHLEHHLFPQVPTCHLSQLAVRLDAVAPELQSKQVF
jgi:fatty acid desaturase